MAVMEIRITVGLSIVAGVQDESHVPVLADQLLKILEGKDPMLKVNSPPAAYLLESITLESTPDTAGRALT
jgi:hypothetical protein